MGSRPRSRGSPADRRRRRRALFLGAAAIEATAVPCSSFWPEVLCAVERRRERTPCELLVREVDAGVDDRQRLPGPGRNGAVRVHERNPPVRSFRRRCLKRRERLVGRDLGDEVRAEQSRQNLERGARRHPPDRKRRGDLHGARFPQRGPCARLREHEPCAVQARARARACSRASAVDGTANARAPNTIMTPRRFKTANIAPVSKTAFVGIGSNLGDREDNLRLAVELLSAEDGVDVTAVSEIRETEPVGPVEQGPFLNGAVRIETDARAAGAARAPARGRAAPRPRARGALGAAHDRPRPAPVRRRGRRRAGPDRARIRGSTSGDSPSSRSPTWLPASKSRAEARFRLCSRS